MVRGEGVGSLGTVVLLMFQIEENKPNYFSIPDLDPYFKLAMDVIKENKDCYWIEIRKCKRSQCQID